MRYFTTGHVFHCMTILLNVWQIKVSFCYLCIFWDWAASHTSTSIAVEQIADLARQTNHSRSTQLEKTWICHHFFLRPQV